MTAAGAVAVLFGGLTILSGGQALFGGPEAHAAAGNVVPFVLWFNFGAGFAYVIAGTGLLIRQAWAVWLSGIIALATVLVFVAFGVHVQQGGAYEVRTIGAMVLRSGSWVLIAVIARRHYAGQRRSKDATLNR